ncbi:hypothetical protein C2E25_08755 [Geothermobacter hydrogeniphilus]|uniref:DUF6933 domain-containing protein n=1 Tax=Geothermobacter hydrogeniphilus TaxID=1969733 RepID=A0A2K2HA38_9BACT|nr:hypothetical protein [Geothermobacter hydrogeniphilus]PNU20131.1 hypothetical protein C2E25_08755 [Geothermobacter hydrogeniphilus]
MIRLHCTKKLLAKLPLTEDGRLRSRQNEPAVTGDDESPLCGWHANLLLLQRRQCVLFVHDTTRFPVFIPALKKADFAELDWHFRDGFMNTLLKVGAETQHMDAAEKLLAPLVCDNNCNRSVQGTLNQMGQELDFMLDYDQTSVTELAPYQTGAWLAERPCTVKGTRDCIWPGQAMLRLLERTYTGQEGDCHV